MIQIKQIKSRAIKTFNAVQSLINQGAAINGRWLTLTFWRHELAAVTGSDGCIWGTQNRNFMHI